jgi:hypothetical protein
MNIPIPKLVPTEAWGDLDSVSREEIKKIFNVFRKAGSIRERIDQVNSFLDPVFRKEKSARRQSKYFASHDAGH